MSLRNPPPQPRRRKLSRDLQALQQALETCDTALARRDESDLASSECCIRTRRNAEICLSGLRELLAELNCHLDAASARQSSQSQAVERPRILVAEDNPANRALIEHQLEVLGWRVDSAADGHGALALWHKKRHPLVLIDKQMPGMDGLQLARTIRSEESTGAARTILIGISAGNYLDEIGPAKAAGMNDVLPKPFELNDLEGMLRANLPAVARLDEPLEFDDIAILDSDYVARSTGPIDAHKRKYLIDLFLMSSEADLLAAQHQCSGDSTQLLRRTLHKLKSAARTVGAMRFAAKSEALEVNVRSGDKTGVRAGLEWLVKECEHIRSAAEQELKVQPIEDPLQAMMFGRMPGVAWIVDADNLAREQLALMMTSHGWGEVRTYGSSEDIQARSQLFGPADLVICDIDLPGMNCIELLCNLHERGNARAVMLTGGDDEKLLTETAHLLRSLGLNLWGELRKPYTHEAFSAVLANGPEVREHLAEKRESITREELLTAIHDDAFDIYFQPKVDSQTLAVAGVEALARWMHKGQHVPPREFIRSAEEHGLIAPLSELLLIKALSGAAELMDAGIHLPLSINLSSNWFHTAKVPELIHACATATGVATSDITFELREDQMLDHLENMRASLQQLRKQGFNLAVDDLNGNRPNALEQIHHLPLNELKLGHALVSEADESPTHRSLLASCVAMAHRLRLSLVAEGVETDRELQLMRDIGCDHIQGWLIAKAMPMPDLIEWLKGHQR